MIEHSVQVEIWKKIVDVQQHFNDLGLRVRNFALAVVGAILALGGYAIKDGGVVTLLGLEVSVAGIIVLSAIFPLSAFYFMDRLWYHRLLEGSVLAGIAAESALQGLGYDVALGTQISQASPVRIWPFGWMMRAKHKMDVFYGILALSLLIVSGVLGFGVQSQAPAAAHNSVVGSGATATAQVGPLPPPLPPAPRPPSAVIAAATAEAEEAVEILKAEALAGGADAANARTNLAQIAVMAAPPPAPSLAPGSSAVPPH